jgi:hypothetical protein
VEEGGRRVRGLGLYAYERKAEIDNKSGFGDGERRPEPAFKERARKPGAGGSHL